jgi:hypothetical protein
MDAGWFLKERTKFIRHFYDEAARPWARFFASDGLLLRAESARLDTYLEAERSRRGCPEQVRARRKKKVASGGRTENGLYFSAPSTPTPYPLFGHRRRNASRLPRLDLSCKP